MFARTNGTESVGKRLPKRDQPFRMNPGEHNQKRSVVCVLCVGVVWYVLVCVGVWLWFVVVVVVQMT